MELTPQSVRTTAFKTVKKGYDPTEVDSFKTQVASAIETAQNQATAMEARARAAVSKLQELTQAGATKDPGSSTPASGTPAAGSPVAAPAAAPAPSAADLTSADAESISRTLLLAQRTADATVADAQREADGIAAAAEAEASSILEAARANATKLVDDARIEGRRANDEERVRAEGEVQALLARRDFLVSDVDHLELHVGAQRERLRDAASALQDLVDRVPAGLGEIRRPLLSASDTSDSSDAASMAAVGDGDATVAAELPLSHDEP